MDGENASEYGGTFPALFRERLAEIAGNSPERRRMPLAYGDGTGRAEENRYVI